MRRISMLATTATMMATGCIVHIQDDPHATNRTSPSAQMENQRSYIPGPVDQVVVNVDVGTVRLFAGYQSDANVDADLTYDWGRRPEVSVYTVGSTLYITAVCPSGSGECRADVDAWIPRDVGLDTTVAVGNVEVADLAGPNWIASIGSGRLTAYGLTTLWSDAFVDVGDIDLGFDTVPDYVAAYAGLGDVNLTVPYGLYDVDTQVGAAGSVWISGIVTDPYALSVIDVIAESGDITINGF